MMMHLMMAAAEKSALKGLLGAFHPGIVHFPIALLAVGALVETVLILRKRPEPWAGTPVLASLAAAAAVPASLFGFILADYGGNEGPGIELHKWLGLASTAFALAAVLVLMGVGLGWNSGERLARSEAQSRYIAAVAPNALH